MIAEIDVFLEIGPDGECLAHALDLPGCVLRGKSQSEVMTTMENTAGEYLAWLTRHGEDVELLEPLTLRIVGTTFGAGPFRRGDQAALVAADMHPPTREEMEKVYFRRAAYAHQDLFALVEGLSDEVLGWRENMDAMTIREILRHIGNAEQWYISRLVPVETLPSEWNHDGEMPELEFLDMARRTAIERLRVLTQAELSAITCPEHWTNHPEERWTVRKALRRMLEHELEHIAHIRQILEAFRNQDRD